MPDPGMAASVDHRGSRPQALRDARLTPLGLLPYDKGERMATTRRTFIDRYEDAREPAVSEWAKDMLRRGVLPMLGLFAVNAIVGLGIIHLLGGNEGEAVVNQSAVVGRAVAGRGAGF